MQRPRGTQDLLGDQILKFRHIEKIAYQIAKQFSFSEIATPIFENHEVFHRTLGEASDMVAKETYDFKDRGGDLLTLRPEGTAPIARAFLSEGMQQHLPLKFYYHGPMFRYERPQRGRYRQFHQIGVEHLGSESPISDAECLLMGWKFIQELGIANEVQVEINTLGDSESRQAFRSALVEYLNQHKSELSPDSKTRLEKNPLRILDSKDPKDHQLLDGAPKLKDHLNTSSQAMFQAVQAQLKFLEIPFVIQERLVRGIDYYCHTVFEITTSQLGAQGTLLAGGRYDGLISSMGGPQVPGVGWASGIERLAELLPASNWQESKVKIGLISADPLGELHLLKIRESICTPAMESILFLGTTGIGKKFKKADKQNVMWAIVVGENEVKQERVSLKNLRSGEQLELTHAEAKSKILESLI